MPTLISFRFGFALFRFLSLNLCFGHRIIDTFGSKWTRLPGCLADKARPASSANLKFRVDSDLECARKCLWAFEDQCRWWNYVDTGAVAGENCELGNSPVHATCTDLEDRTGYQYYEKV